MDRPKISYSNLKTLYRNVYQNVAELDLIPTNPKSIFTEFLNDVNWIESYIEALWYDIELMADDDYPSMVEFRKDYERYVEEWELWLDWLNSN